MDDHALKQLMAEALISIDDPITVNPTCIKVQDRNWGTLSNFSCIIGKPKAKKSFLVTLALAAAMVRKSQGISVDLPDEKDQVLLFDTEQSRPDVVKTLNRVATVSGQHPLNLTAYGLRKYPPAERFEAIEGIIAKSDGVGLVVIDGVKDLVSSINDEEQANAVVSALLRWTEEYNIHIVVILHQNKGDTNARGHLGTEIANKSETLISVTIDKNDKTISHVKCEYSRDREFEPFSFQIIDEQIGSDTLGIPKVLEGYMGVDLTYKRPESVKLTDDQVSSIIKGAFEGYSTLQLKNLTPAIKESLISHGLRSTGTNNAGAIKKRAEDMGVLVKIKEGKGYPVYRIFEEKSK